MKTPLLIAAVLAVELSAPLAAQVLHESPFVCDMSMLTPAERAHKEDIAGQLAIRRIGLRELPDGYEFSFPGDPATLQMLNDWVGTERLCCPFFDIDVRLAPEKGPTTIRLTGRPGTKAFIKADFERWLKS